MAKKERISETPATQWLRRQGIEFSEHPYPYQEHGGTTVSARGLGVDEHALLVSSSAIDIIVELCIKALILIFNNVHRKDSCGGVNVISMSMP